MSMTLCDEDRRALDLLLDRTLAASVRGDGNGGGNGHGVVFAAHSGVPTERLESAEKVLRMLELLPAGDPPQDLLSRTLRRVDEASAGLTPVRNVMLDSPRPVA